MSAAAERKTHQDGEEFDLPLELVKTNMDTQSRVEMHQQTVDEYADLMQAGTVFPPLTVFFDSRSYILADGFHRLHAARKLKLPAIRVKIRNGNRLAAVLYAAGANRDHGLRRTNADKRKAVASILLEKFWADKSDNWVAEQVGVTQPFVSKIRREFIEKGALPKSLLATLPAKDGLKTVLREGKDGRTINTANIGGKGGRKPKESPPPPQEDTTMRTAAPEPIIEHKRPVPVLTALPPVPQEPKPMLPVGAMDNLRMLALSLLAQHPGCQSQIATGLRALAEEVAAS